MLYSCTHMATVDVKGLTVSIHKRTRDVDTLQASSYVRLSVRRSVTRWHCVKTAKHIVEILSPPDNPDSITQDAMRSRVRNGPSRSFKVVDFGTNRKGIWNFLLVINTE